MFNLTLSNNNTLLGPCLQELYKLYKRSHNSLLMQPPHVHVWLQIITLALTASPISSKHQCEHTSMTEALSADLNSIWASILVWEGGSMVKRITQNSPTRCSLTPCQLFSSIRPSLVPSFTLFFFHLSVCGYICLFFSFYPCQEDYTVPPSHVPPHPPQLISSPQLLCFSHLVSLCSHIPKSFITNSPTLMNSPSTFK